MSWWSARKVTKEKQQECHSEFRCSACGLDLQEWQRTENPLTRCPRCHHALRPATGCGNCHGCSHCAN
ncbi:zinc ribbon domain-containing protein [Heliophilum fasciatum]|uniref:Uncharacterized protein n=1 Tax=Heliophilum fasciatum TaxID=35700 RepID=A0A4R2RYM6_9FIRM|nr:zinc ribbon domain-containing protein [Heliophilum fasciatum]MCW2277186.1 DNA-directed RNA polymerase subunit RPC12/RpoP [Heliophilum fasciatum]TCP68179.1 hypothetical protein EDD73_10482 [Heliophilum fasciatum]